MTANSSSVDDRGLLAIDVGNSRVKLGWFPAAVDCASEKPGVEPGLAVARPVLAPPAKTTAIRHRDRPTAEWLGEVHAWCDHVVDAPLWQGVIATVHPAAADAVEGALSRRDGNRLRRIAGGDLPLEVSVESPQRVGVDRLLNALAAKAIVQPGKAAVVVDMGTAITVDLLDERGAFAGGAILPGPSLSAEALHTGTAALPDLSTAHGAAAPPAVGKTTEQAIVAGVFWGAVGATRELCRRFLGVCPVADLVVLTGGSATAFSEHLVGDAYVVRHVPELTLSGLYIAGQALDP